MILDQAQGDSLSAGLQTRRLEQKQFRPDIEGLRAIAVLGVVLFHAHIPGVGGGFVGVDVFFVISGFLITGLLWREVNTTGTIRMGRFFGARARRLLPASATVGIITMISATALLSPLQSRVAIVDGIASALYVSNYRFALQGVDYLAADLTPSLFQHYWSLGVEEQFYLVWPTLIIGTTWLIQGMRRRTRARATPSQRPYAVVLALVAGLSFALSLIVTRLVPPLAFYSLPTRAWQLAVGGLVALTAHLWHRVPHRAAAVMGWAGLGLIVLACTRFSANTQYPGIAALLPTLGAALVIGAGCAIPAHGCGRVLGLSPMRAIGRVSYSWYLWHWPILLLALWGLAPVIGHALLLALLGIMLSFVLAVLTLRVVENPLRFSSRIRSSTRRSLGLGALATAVAVCVGIGLLKVIPIPIGHGPPAPPLTMTATPVPAGSGVDAYDAALRHAFAEVQAAIAVSSDLKAVPSNLTPPLADSAASVKVLQTDACMLGVYQSAQPECAAGDTTSTTSIALVGDSNGAMWNPALQEAARQLHWRLETMTKASCPLLDLPFINPGLKRRYTECEQWRDETLARLRSEHPRLIVLGVKRRYGAPYEPNSGFAVYDQQWIASLARLVYELRRSGARVLVLGPLPSLPSMVADCLSKHLDDVPACSPPTSSAVNRPGITAEAAATQAAGGDYADITSLFCDTDRCPVIIGNTLVYFDKTHITADYSRLLAPVIRMLAGRTLASGQS